MRYQAHLPRFSRVSRPASTMRFIMVTSCGLLRWVPRISAVGAYITIPGGGGEVTGMAPDVSVPAFFRAGVASGPAEVTQKVNYLLQNGADSIKLIATGAVLAQGTEPGAQEMSEDDIRAALGVRIERITQSQFDVEGETPKFSRAKPRSVVGEEGDRDDRFAKVEQEPQVIEEHAFLEVPCGEALELEVEEDDGLLAGSQVEFVDAIGLALAHDGFRSLGKQLDRACNESARPIDGRVDVGREQEHEVL